MIATGAPSLRMAGRASERHTERAALANHRGRRRAT
jgi:hypothetical protein